MEKIIDKKRSIGQVGEEIGVPTHVIRFWESKFPQIKPEIGKGSRRYYFDKDLAILNKIKSMLHEEGYSIAGLQKLLKKRKKSDSKEQNIEFLLSIPNEQIVKNTNQSDKDFAIEDFIQPANIDKNSTPKINQLIARIEANLRKLEQ
jgi:DNA-binding transcriptional MerR regulator